MPVTDSSTVGGKVGGDAGVAGGVAGKNKVLVGPEPGLKYHPLFPPNSLFKAHTYVRENVTHTLTNTQGVVSE